MCHLTLGGTWGSQFRPPMLMQKALHLERSSQTPAEFLSDIIVKIKAHHLSSIIIVMLFSACSKMILFLLSFQGLTSDNNMLLLCKLEMQQFNFIFLLTICMGLPKYFISLYFLDL